MNRFSQNNELRKRASQTLRGSFFVLEVTFPRGYRGPEKNSGVFFGKKQIFCCQKSYLVVYYFPRNEIPAGEPAYL